MLQHLKQPDTPEFIYRGLQVEELEDRMMLSTVEIFAAGATGTEQMDLFIDQSYVKTFSLVAGDPDTREFQRFAFETEETLVADQIGIAFGNDLYLPESNFDRDLVVNKIILDGETYETEHPSVFSTGIYRDGGTTAPGNYETEVFNINSIFTYSSEGRSTPDGSIVVHAYGTTGDEIFQIRSENEVFGQFNVTDALARYEVAVSSNITADQIQIRFLNDRYEPEFGVDRNLVVEHYKVNGEDINPRSSNVFSTGTWLSADGVVDGFGRDNILHTNGYFQVQNDVVSSLGTLIRFKAKGDTGEEILRVSTKSGLTIAELEIDRGESDRAGGRVANEFIVDTEFDVALEDIRLEFINNGVDQFGADRNLTIESIVVDDLDTDRVQRTTTRDSNTFSTGVYRPEDGIVPGFGRGETLFVNGYFEFQESSSLELGVFGNTGTERFNVIVNGEVRATLTALQNEVQFLDLDEVVTDKDIRIEFVNDGNDDQGLDRNLRIGVIFVDGRRHSATPETTTVSGAFDYSPGAGIRLYENGYVQFGVDDPGSVRFLNLGSTRSSLASFGSETIPIQRLGENDGEISFDWVINDTFGNPSFPLAERSGTVTMRDDQTLADLTIVFADTTTTGVFQVELINPSESLEFLNRFLTVVVQ